MGTRKPVLALALGALGCAPTPVVGVDGSTSSAADEGEGDSGAGETTEAGEWGQGDGDGDGDGDSGDGDSGDGDGDSGDGDGDSGDGDGDGAVMCGNGIIEAGEQCDDGNFDDDDGCYVDCIEDRVPLGEIELDFEPWRLRGLELGVAVGGAGGAGSHRVARVERYSNWLFLQSGWSAAGVGDSSSVSGSMVFSTSRAFIDSTVSWQVGGVTTCCEGRLLSVDLFGAGVPVEVSTPGLASQLEIAPLETDVVILDPGGLTRRSGATLEVVWTVVASPSGVLVGDSTDGFGFSFFSEPDRTLTRYDHTGALDQVLDVPASPFADHVHTSTRDAGTHSVSMFDPNDGITAHVLQQADWDSISASNLYPGFGELQSTLVTPSGATILCGAGNGPLIDVRSPAGAPLWRYREDGSVGTCRHVAIDEQGVVYAVFGDWSPGSTWRLLAFD